MINIVKLTDIPTAIPRLAELWYERISRDWVPNASVARCESGLHAHLNHDTLPMTLVALENQKPIGMASLREHDGIMPGILPWLGSLVVDPSYRKQGVGQKLINAVEQEAKKMGFGELFLLAFDLTIPSWYEQLGYKHYGKDQLFNHPVTVMVREI